MQKTLDISSRGKSAPASPVRKLVPLAEQTKKKGIKVYHVNIGDPDFKIPKPIKHELQHIAKNIKRLPYTSSKGSENLFEAWIKYYHDIGIELTKEDMLITSGGSEALILTSAILFDPGDEYLVFEPFYANYNAFGNLVSAKVVPIQLDPNTGYHLPTDAEIKAKITNKTKAIFFTNPNNPTGTVFTDDEVKRMVQLAAKHNLFLVSDETYRGMCFDGKKMLSVMDVATEKEKQNIIITDSVSKRLNACGARVGIIISKNRDVIDAAFRFAQGRLSVAYIEQEMMVPALRDSLPYLAWVTKQYEKRRNVFIDELEKKLKMKIHRPEGAFYTMLQLPVDDTDEFARWMLTDFNDNNETVMVAPGAGFYATSGKGKQEVRVAYVLNEKDLKRAAKLLAMGVKQYNALKS